MKTSKTANKHSLRPLSFEEFKSLKRGDTVFVGCDGSFYLSRVCDAPFYNCDADEPGWEVDTNNGFCDQYSVYRLKDEANIETAWNDNDIITITRRQIRDVIDYVTALLEAIDVDDPTEFDEGYDTIIEPLVKLAYAEKACSLTLPCEVGTDIFFIHDTCNEEGIEGMTISEGKIVSFSKDAECLWAYARYNTGLTYWHLAKDFGETIFFSREEAKKALNSIQTKNNKTKEI